MKKSVLFLGFILILLNSAIGIVISGYNPINVGLVDLSIAISTGLIYYTSVSPMNDGFKIGLNYLFVFSGLIRVICALLFLGDIKNSISIIIFIVILSIEIILIFISENLKNK
jgi:hypothetical protein